MTRSTALPALLVLLMTSAAQAQQTVDVSRFSLDRFARGELAWDEAMI